MYCDFAVSTKGRIMNTLTEKKALKAKSQLNSFFLNYIKKTILDQIKSSGKDYILGSFPHWKSESIFDKNIKQNCCFEFQDTTCDEGVIESYVVFSQEIILYTFEKYSISLMFKISAYEDSENDYVTFSSENDFKKIKSFKIFAKSFLDETDVAKMKDLIKEFEHIKFLLALKG